jgi:hypothetical protein
MILAHWLAPSAIPLKVFSMLRNCIWLAAGVVSLGVTANAFAVSLPPNDYPTEARADYLFACMQVTRLAHEVFLLN